MTKKRDIRKEHIKHLFKGVKDAINYIESHGYVMSDYKTIDAVVAKLEKDIAADIARKNERLKAAGSDAHVFSGTQIPIVRDLPASTRAQLTRKIESALNDVDKNGYNPRFIQIHLNNAFKPYNGPNILGSDERGEIVALLRNKYESYLAKSSEEARRYKERIRNLLKREYHLSDKAKDRAKLNDYMKQLKFVEYVIDKSNLDGIDLTYTINGRIVDYVQYVTTVCSYEPLIDITVDREGAPINCFIACILDQAPEYLRGDKLRLLLERNGPDFTFTDVEQVCKDFGLYVMIFDCGADVWKVYDYRSRNGRESRNRNIYLVVYNGHAMCLKEEYRLRTAHNTTGEIESIKLEYVEDFIYGAKDTKRVFKTGATCKIHLDNSSPNAKVIGLKVVLQRKPYVIIDYKEISSDYVIYIDGDGMLKKCMEFLVEDGIVPVVIGDGGDDIICLTIQIGKQRHILQLRSSKSIHDLTDIVPNSHNHTFGSSVMHLFRKQLVQPIMKIPDPVIAKIMKHMCRPTIYMKQIKIPASSGKQVYLIDLKRAYRNNCQSLGCFKKPPSFKMNPEYTSYVGKTNKLKPGMYELYGKHDGGIWVTKDELVYRVKRGEPLRYRYYILFDDKTDVLSEFADYIDSPDSIFSELTSSCRKNAFNILVGKLNPNIDTVRSYSIFKNKIDLDRFLFKGDKKIYRITILCSDDEYCMPSWLVEYAYNTDDNHMVGTNASYLSAQIINRCKLKIRKMRDRLTDLGCDVVGSMTDSVLFVAPSGFDLMRDVDLDLNEWSIEATGDSMMSRGVGQYKIYRNGEVVHDRHQGYEESLNDSFLSLMVNLVRRYGRESFSSLDIDSWVNQLADHKLIIGKAGYGKSTYIRQNYSKSDWIRCAHPKLAASEIDGYTICGLFKLGKKGNRPIEEALLKIKGRTRSLLLRARGLVIDEVYTVPSNVMGSVDQILKFIRGSSLPFGGMELILCGDDRQTEAIGSSFIGSPLYKTIRERVERIELVQHDNMRLTYIYDNFCLKFRDPNMSTEELMRLINDERFSSSEVVGRTVYYLNESVDYRNELEMQKYIDDHPDAEVVMVNDCKYAIGCPVMLLKNCCKGLYNGSLATLCNVKTSSKGDVSVTLKGNGIETTKLADNIDIAPAFAMTIHRAQCKTFPGINIYIRQKDIDNDDRDRLMRLLYTAMTRVRDFGDCYIKIIDS